MFDGVVVSSDVVVGKTMVSIVIVVVVVVDDDDVDVDVDVDVDEVVGVTVTERSCKKRVVPNVSTQASRSKVCNGFRFHQCQNVYCC
jgi:hypothetical protein